MKTGECPQCEVPHHELGINGTAICFRDLEKILATDALADEDPVAFVHECLNAGVKPVYHPFWMRHPYLNIFRSITLDILHQLLQGVFKHIVAWIKSVFSHAELDARCKRLPPNHNVQLFLNGISNLSQLTGKEHAEMACILLGIIIDLPLPDSRNSDQLIRAVRVVLDFLYLAQYPVHTTESLTALVNALDSFHDNKDIFVELNIRDSFNIPKLHSLQHYAGSIKLFGTTNNYNTQATEQLHIDYAKEAYRSTNHKDEYPQMTIWLERKEKIARHESHIMWRLTARHTAVTPQQTTTLVLDRFAKMPKHPSVSAVPLEVLVRDYCTPYLCEALARFVVTTNHPDWTHRQVEEAALDIVLPFRKLPVFHRMKFVCKIDEAMVVVDSIHVSCVRKKKKQGRLLPGRFDTALVRIGDCAEIGVQGN